MAVTSRIVRLVIAALFVAGSVGAAIHFARPRNHATSQPVVAPSALPAPVPSIERVVQLQGHIVNANGDAVIGAHVRVIAGAHAVAETATDSAGAFSFDRLADGPVRVEADHEPEGAVDSAQITISNATTDLTLALSPAGVGGVVVDGDSGHVIAGATLSLDGAPFPTSSATSDAAGAFRFAAAPFEATAVVATASGYRTSRVALGARENNPEPSLRILLRASPAIEGDVVDAENKPIHASVTACENTPLEAHVESGDDGTFELPPSTIGCDAFAVHDGLASSDATPIVEGRHLTLRLGAGGSIAGFAVDDQGGSIDAFSVGIEAFVPARGAAVPPGGATPFQHGSFHLDRLAPGTYVLTAVTAGRPPARSDRITVKSGAVTDNIKIVIPRGGIVEGRVLDEQHAPLADVELTFDSVSAIAKSDAVTKTDSSGHYHLEGAPAGPFTVSAHKDGYRHKLVSGLSVSSGDTTVADIMLTKGSGFELTGIGANVARAGNAIAFAGILPGDPAELAGLHPGDHIVRIDGEEIGGLSIEDIIQRLRGTSGSVVGVTVERGGETLDLVITRAVVVH